MKKYFYLVLILSSLHSLSMFGQSQYSSSSATGSGLPTTLLTDYQCVGINPANLGWSNDNKQFHLGLAEVGVGIYSEAITKKEIENFFTSDDPFTETDKIDAAKRFANSRMVLDAEAVSVGFSFQKKNVGGFAFKVNDRNLWNIKLNTTAAEILWLGFNSDYFDLKEVDPITQEIVAGISTNPMPAVDLLKGTRITSLWIREYGFSYGRHIFESETFKLYGGIGLKYIQGYSIIEINTEGSELTAFSSLSPVFDINYPKESPSSLSGTNFDPVGNGFGIDLGLTADIVNQFRLSAAINDIGNIKWDGNVYQASYSSTIKRIETGGLGNESIADLIDALAVQDEVFQWEGVASIDRPLPSTLRGGAAYIGMKKLHAGFDILVPLNDAPGSRDAALWNLGLRYQPLRSIAISSGVGSGGDASFHWSLGFDFTVANTWEIGLATRDITTLFKSENPYLSMVFGLLRFKFGGAHHSTDVVEDVQKI